MLNTRFKMRKLRSIQNPTAYMGMSPIESARQYWYVVRAPAAALQGKWRPTPLTGGSSTSANTSLQELLLQAQQQYIASGTLAVTLKGGTGFEPCPEIWDLECSVTSGPSLSAEDISTVWGRIERLQRDASTVPSPQAAPAPPPPKRGRKPKARTAASTITGETPDDWVWILVHCHVVLSMNLRVAETVTDDSDGNMIAWSLDRKNSAHQELGRDDTRLEGVRSRKRPRGEDEGRAQAGSRLQGTPEPQRLYAPIEQYLCPNFGSLATDVEAFLGIVTTSRVPPGAVKKPIAIRPGVPPELKKATSAEGQT